MSNSESNLLQKTELWIKPIRLQGADLNHVAATVAETLGMEPGEVLVTDVQNEHLTLDILRQTMDPRLLVGRQNELLRALAGLPGVRITDATSIHSNGMLGWIAFDGNEASEALDRSERMVEEIRLNLSRRAMVLSTGSEVASRQIIDTNTPTIAARLQAEGYVVKQGPTLKDDRDLIAGTLRRAVYDDGYALVITTGGVGAEEKDHTVEALLTLDPEAATPYICRFEKGTGRHVKDGVRIGVARLEDSLIIALPGPNDEVRASMDVLARELKADTDKHHLAEEIAANLRQKLREKMQHREHARRHITASNR